jgi:hypothetical protein
MSSTGLRPKSDCSLKAQKSKVRVRVNCRTILLSERAPPHQETRNCQTENKDVVYGLHMGAIVACIPVPMGAFLPSCHLVMAASSGFNTLPYRGHDMIICPKFYI